LSYLAKWPELCFTGQASNGQLMGYSAYPPPKTYGLTMIVLGKVEGEGKLWHGHVTAVTVAPEYRRLGLARNLMKLLEDISEKV
jgi:N-terminal acetyltransferase B complex catalytic subunit